MADKFQVQISLGKEVSVFFIRLAHGELVMGFDINPRSQYTFDKHRPPVAIMDGGAAIDFGEAEAIHKIMESTDQISIHYRFEPHVVTAVIWHGQDKVRAGNIASLLSTKSLRLKVYYGDYTSEETTFDAGSLTALQKKLMDGLGL
jgi:hypothetical protein